MNKLIPLLVFSILFLVPVGVQNSFGNHPEFTCPPPGELNQDIFTTFQGTPNFCFELSSPPPNCLPGYEEGSVEIGGNSFPNNCLALAIPNPTPAAACQNGAVLDNTGHCVPDFPNICSTGTVQAGFTCIAQAMSSIVGGTLLETNTLPLLVGAIGTNPIITGLVGITIAGIVGQTAWFVHRRRKSGNS